MTDHTRQDDPNTPWIVIYGIFGALTVFVVIVALQALFYTSYEAEFERKVVNQVPQELVQLRAKQQEKLNGYRWVDEKNGVVAIPIERAMAAVVERHAASAGGAER